MAQLPPELAGLPPPRLVEALDYEVRLNELRAKLVSIFAAAGIEYDVGNLETDPAQILQQVAAYQDIALRQRINEAIQSWFLAYAAGGDLDVLAQWYDVSRLPGETDDALRRRIILAIQGRSTGGTAARYRSIALGASVRVSDAAVYTVGRDPTVHVAIFATDNGGVADQALIDTVNAALQNPASRMVNDTILVAGAVRQSVDVAANVWLLPSAPESTLAQMQARLQSAWARDMLLGRDLTRSWLTAQLHADGVQRVELIEPSSDIVVPFNQAAAAGTVTLTKMGRTY